MIHLTKEQELLTDTLKHDAKALIAGIYNIFAGLIYWLNKGIKQIIIWHAITFYVIGILAFASFVKDKVLNGKPFLIAFDWDGTLTPSGTKK